MNLPGTSEARIWLLESKGKVEIIHFHLCHRCVRLLSTGSTVAYCVAEEKEGKKKKENRQSDILWLLPICQRWNKAVTRQGNCKFVAAG